MEQDQRVRGRGRNKCFWTDYEVQVLITTLQDMACDPSWKTDGGFKSNYMAEVHRRMLSKIPTLTKQVTPHLESKIKWLKTRFHIINDMCRQSGCQWNDVEKKIACEKQWFDSYCQTHKEAKGMWDFKFPYLNQLELVYGRDRATGVVVQGYVDAIRNLEVDRNDDSGGENLGAFYHSSNEYEEDNNVYFESESSPTASHNIDVTKSATKRKQPLTTGYNAKKKQSTVTQLDIGTQLHDMNSGFRTFVDGFNANFATIANVMAEENLREKKASERMKEVIAELMNLSLPSGDVFKAANIFTADRDKIDVLFNLPSELRRNYVVSLLVPFPNM